MQLPPPPGAVPNHRLVATIVVLVILMPVAFGLGSALASPADRTAPRNSNATTSSLPDVIRGSRLEGVPPLDPGRYVEEPCDLLTNLNIVTLGVLQSAHPDLSAIDGPGCVWSIAESRTQPASSSVTVRFLTRYKSFDEYWQERKPPEAPPLRTFLDADPPGATVPLRWFPSFVVETTQTPERSAHCTVAVAISNQFPLAVDFAGPPTDPRNCSKAELVAVKAVTWMSLG